MASLSVGHRIHGQPPHPYGGKSFRRLTTLTIDWRVAAMHASVRPSGTRRHAITDHPSIARKKFDFRAIAWITPKHSSHGEITIGGSSEWARSLATPTLSHGENRGSSPLGSASKINGFCGDGRARPPLKPPFQCGHRLVKSPRAGAFQIGEF